MTEENFEPTGLGSIELAWAAGFFDGEGCITLSRGNPIIEISQVDPEVLYRFRDAVGVGVVNGPYAFSPNKVINSRPQYRYQLSRLDDVRLVIDKLNPFLSSIKKTTAKRLLNLTKDKIGRPIDFRLTSSEVAEIRVMFEAGSTISDLVQQFKKDDSTIRRIVKRQTWKAVN